MNYSALIFLGTFFALASSWFGLVFLPDAQIGGQLPDKTDQLTVLESRTNWIARQHGLTEKGGGLGAFYPLARPGLAQLGAEIYRANGCVYCHTRQVHQTGTTFDALLLEAGTNQVEVANAVLKLKPQFSKDELAKFFASLPKTLLQNVEKNSADAAVKSLEKAGAKPELRIVPLGADIARGWGVRQTVAQDYLYDSPVMLGSQRVGPDLANIGARLPDAGWHLQHLYNPRIEVKNSTMPPYRFLFEQRKIHGQPSPDALKVDSVPAGFEIVPTTAAKALAAYLVSLRADAPLFETPMSTPTISNATNAPAK